jgi:FdrA protein
MNSAEIVRIERGRYHDSVTLLRASAAARELDGVETAIAAMGTELNRDLLVDAGFALDGEATPDDLVMAVRATDEAIAQQAVDAVEQVLAERPRPGSGGDGDGMGRGVVPHTVEAAAALAPDAGIVVVSVPGSSAYVEAAAAVRSGRHVMVFSDGVDVDAEVALKREAAGAGVLVMGPDCGTVIIGGVGLGFANRVVPGPVGIVAASGTGAQQLCGLLDGARIGVRHVLGVGGRDVSAAVGGASTLAALAALDDDPAVEVIAVVSKPPDRAVARTIEQAARSCRTPVVLGLVGHGRSTVTTAAADVAGVLGRPFEPPDTWAPLSGSAGRPRHGPLLGLFSGGTDCFEAIAVLEPLVGAVRSNVHHDPGRRIGPDEDAGGTNVLLDLGDDELTVGRPHPMIDPGAVVERVARAAADPDGPGVVLLDVVLGLGAHPDPGAVLAPAIAAAGRAGVAAVVTLVGTGGDPQGLDRQAEVLASAGAQVHRSNARAAGQAAVLARSVGTRL